MATATSSDQVPSQEFEANLLKKYRLYSKELVKLQHIYKTLLGKPALNKVESIKKKNFIKKLKQLKREKAEILANLKVALGKVHLQEYNKHIKTIEKHVHCQERLQEEIETLSTQIDHLRNQQIKVDQEIYYLNFKATSECQHNETVKRATTALHILENQLDVSKKRECALITKNLKLRNHIAEMLRDRELFNKLWWQMIGHLDHDKKFLIDIVERSIECFEQGTDVCQKLRGMEIKKKRDIESKIIEMQDLIKRGHADKYNKKFLLDKSKSRELAELEPRERKRREIFKLSHKKKIALYAAILDKVLSFSGVATVSEAIEKFQNQEEKFYSYFNYMNHLGYQVQVLNKYVDGLYRDITDTRKQNISNEFAEMEKIVALEKKLNLEQQKTNQKQSEKDNFEMDLVSLFEGLHDIFNLLQCDDEPLQALLGDHTKITVFNVERFLKIFENKMNSVLAYVYVTERKQKTRTERLTVQNVIRQIEDATPVEDIVLAQQCAECAEGEDVKPYDVEFVHPKSLEDVKNDLREKVRQPEMELRLHTISQCRLPRSRLLADKRY